jgi:hypothetical protein
LVASDKGVVSRGELRAQIEVRLPGFMMPAASVELDAIPLPRKGKIDRLRLPAPEGVRQVGAYVAPRTELESRISQLWSEVHRVGIHDSFFDLSGNSLLIVKLRTRIADKTGVAMLAGAPESGAHQVPAIGGLCRARRRKWLSVGTTMGMKMARDEPLLEQLGVTQPSSVDANDAAMFAVKRRPRPCWAWLRTFPRKRSQSCSAAD